MPFRAFFTPQLEGHDGCRRSIYLKTWDKFESLTLVQCFLVNVLTQEGSPLGFQIHTVGQSAGRLRGSIQL